MIKIDISKTQLLENGLRFDLGTGVLLVEASRCVLDPAQPRKVIIEDDLKELRADIDSWRQQKHGLAGTGIMRPLKGRWETGAVVGTGQIREGARVWIWDGGKTLRITTEEQYGPTYDWLPLTLDTLSTKEARSAALRTSIHERGHVPTEQGEAFADEMRDDGLSYREMAKKYSVDKSYIENRVNLALCKYDDVKEFAAAYPKKMSHALAVRDVADKDLRKDLLELAAHGATVDEIKKELHDRQSAADYLEESQSFPDAETEAANAKNNRYSEPKSTQNGHHNTSSARTNNNYNPPNDPVDPTKGAPGDIQADIDRAVNNVLGSLQSLIAARKGALHSGKDVSPEQVQAIRTAARHAGVI